MEQQSDSKKAVANFLFEVGMLNKTPRSGFHFLGSGEQSVAEHNNRTIYCGYVLAMLAGDVDVAQVLKMCLFHDLSETRVSDLNYVHQKYVTKDENKAIKDLTKTLPFGEDINQILKEYHDRKTKESLIAKDADNLEWILSLKEQVDIGNNRAQSWLPIAIKRLQTKEAKTLADIIINTRSDEWWFGDSSDQWWVSRGKK